MKIRISGGLFCLTGSILKLEFPIKLSAIKSNLSYAVTRDDSKCRYSLPQTGFATPLFFPIMIIPIIDLSSFPMKLFAYIMMLIIFVVSLAPCKDLSAGSGHGKATAQIIQDDHHEHEDGSDDCPPFCACSCCAAYGYPKSNIGSPQAASVFAPIHADRYTGSLFSVSLPIWQPPQLVA